MKKQNISKHLTRWGVELEPSALQTGWSRIELGESKLKTHAMNSVQKGFYSNSNLEKLWKLWKIT